MSLGKFRLRVVQLWMRALRRRSQKDGASWTRMTKLAGDFLPKPKILHPWPSVRFAARHPRQEPDALNWARPDLCGGRGVTREPCTLQFVRWQINPPAARKAASLSRPFRLMTSSGRSGPAFPSSALQAGRYPGTRFGRRSCVQGGSMRGFVARECEGEGRNYDDPGAGH
jgi:hypothetical protein